LRSFFNRQGLFPCDVVQHLVNAAWPFDINLPPITGSSSLKSALVINAS